MGLAALLALGLAPEEVEGRSVLRRFVLLSTLALRDVILSSMVLSFAKMALVPASSSSLAVELLDS